MELDGVRCFFGGMFDAGRQWHQKATSAPRTEAMGTLGVSKCQPTEIVVLLGCKRKGRKFLKIYRAVPLQAIFSLEARAGSGGILGMLCAAAFGPRGEPEGGTPCGVRRVSGEGLRPQGEQKAYELSWHFV